MTKSIQEALALAKHLEQIFENTLQEKFPGTDRWAWYHALDNAKKDHVNALYTPLAEDLDIAMAHEAWIKQLHKYCLLRDGPNGVLGGSGL